MLDIETGMQEVVGDFPGMTFAPRFSPDGKIIMSFAKDGNSDIYTMDLENRIVEKITNHPSIDTSPHILLMENIFVLIQIEADISKFMMNSDGSKVKEFLEMEFMELLYGRQGDLIAFTKFIKESFILA